MSLLQFFVFIVVLGLVWWLVDAYLPLPDPVKLVIRVVAVIVLIFLVLSLFGIVTMPFKIA
jgi:hypothetical protein